MMRVIPHKIIRSLFVLFPVDVVAEIGRRGWGDVRGDL